MIKYEFMRAHGKGLEGSEKKGGVRIKKRGCEKKGVHAARAPPPLYTPLHIGTPWFKFRYQA